MGISLAQVMAEVSLPKRNVGDVCYFNFLQLLCAILSRPAAFWVLTAHSVFFRLVVARVLGFSVDGSLWLVLFPGWFPLRLWWRCLLSSAACGHFLSTTSPGYPKWWCFSVSHITNALGALEDHSVCVLLNVCEVLFEAVLKSGRSPSGHCFIWFTNGLVTFTVCLHAGVSITVIWSESPMWGRGAPLYLPLWKVQTRLKKSTELVEFGKHSLGRTVLRSA